MRTKTSWTSYGFAVLVIAFATIYFLLSFNHTLNTTDEGYLLHNIQKTANGQLPHRDFYDDYGPASYWLGAVMFKVFGTKILVIRLSMVVLKTFMALLVFLIALRMLPTVFAFVGAFLFVLNWGDPLFGAINTLYAGHFNHLFALLGALLLLLYSDTGNKRWLLGTGICVGLSMIFKLPTAVIDLIGFALFLCLKEQVSKPSTETSQSLSSPAVRTLQILRALKLIGIVSVIVFYLVYVVGSSVNLYTFFLFLLPLTVFLARLLVIEFTALRDMRDDTRSRHWKRLRLLYTEMTLLLIPPVILVAATIIFYAIVGGLPELIYDTFVLPSFLKFHHPLQNQRMLAAIVAILVFAILFAIAFGKGLAQKTDSLRALFAGIVLLAVILIPAFGLIKVIPYRTWHMLVTHILLPIIPFVGLYIFCAQWQWGQWKENEAGRFLGLGLTLILTCQSMMMIFVRSDETHIVLNSTFVFVLAAFILRILYRELNQFTPKLRSAPGLIAVLAWLVTASVPYLWSMKILHMPTTAADNASSLQVEQGSPYPLLTLDAPRARGLRLPIAASPTPPLSRPMIIDLNKTVNFIRDHTRPDESIFLICGDQIIYFLAERESVLQKENYFAYLSNVELIEQANTGRVTDEDILLRLSSSMPRLVVQTPRYADTIQFARTWPRAHHFIKSNYEILSVFGEYQVLGPRHARISTPN